MKAEVCLSLFFEHGSIKYFDKQFSTQSEKACNKNSSKDFNANRLNEKYAADKASVNLKMMFHTTFCLPRDTKLRNLNLTLEQFRTLKNFEEDLSNRNFMIITNVKN